jgi:FkbM family methyltransferase
MGFLRRAKRHGLPQHLFDLRDLSLEQRDENQAAIRGLCTTAYLGGSDAVCRVLGRYKVFVDTSDVGLSTHLMLDGYWEMWLTEAIAKAVKPGMVAVDIGANLGYFTLLMAELVGPEGRVHAFEPNPPIAKRLAKSIDVNGFRKRALIHHEPLGARDGLEVALISPPGEPKNAHVVHQVEPEIGVHLTTARFDSDPRLLEADIIKIDAEAAELDIWRGMSGLFETSSKPLTIFMEFASVRYDDAGGFLEEVRARGFDLGLVTFRDGVQPRSRDEILAAPGDVDQMLILRRNAR